MQRVCSVIWWLNYLQIRVVIRNQFCFFDSAERKEWLNLIQENKIIQSNSKKIPQNHIWNELKKERVNAKHVFNQCLKVIQIPEFSCFIKQNRAWERSKKDDRLLKSSKISFTKFKYSYVNSRETRRRLNSSWWR